MRRLGQTFVLGFAALILCSSPAQAADGNGNGNRGNGSGSTGYAGQTVFAVYAEAPSEVATPTRGLVREPTIYCYRIPEWEAGATERLYSPDEIRAWAQTNRRPPSELPLVACFRRDATVSYSVRYAPWNPADPTGGAGTTIETVEAYAQNLIVVPRPSLASAPPADRLIVGFETWFDVADFGTVVRSAQAGPLWATATATAIEIEIIPEPGAAPIRCPAPAAPRPSGQRPECLRHTYRDVDRATGTRTTNIEVRVVYEVTLTSSDNPTPRVVDQFTSAPLTAPITIREIQTVLR